jgi:hypothetical protein
VWGGGDGTKVQAWDCEYAEQQHWYIPGDGTIQSSRFPGMCLDADTQGGGRDGTIVQLWRCENSPQQHWFFRTDGSDLAIYNQLFLNNGNTVLDRDVRDPGNGDQIQLWTKNFQPQQWWQVQQD